MITNEFQNKYRTQENRSRIQNFTEDLALYVQLKHAATTGAQDKLARENYSSNDIVISKLCYCRLAARSPCIYKGAHTLHAPSAALRLGETKIFLHFTHNLKTLSHFVVITHTTEKQNGKSTFLYLF